MGVAIVARGEAQGRYRRPHFRVIGLCVPDSLPYRVQTECKLQIAQPPDRWTSQWLVPAQMEPFLPSDRHILEDHVVFQVLQTDSEEKNDRQEHGGGAVAVHRFSRLGIGLFG